MTVAADLLVLDLVRDDSLTRGLGDEEAKMLVEWMANWAELLIEAARNENEAKQLTARLRRRGKAIARFVTLWCDPQTRASANQLAASERFAWPLPITSIPAADLMHEILSWENQHHE